MIDIFEAFNKMQDEVRETAPKPEESILHKDQPKEPEQADDFKKMIEGIPANLLSNDDFISRIVEKMEFIRSQKEQGEPEKETDNDAE